MKQRRMGIRLACSEKMGKASSVKEDKYLRVAHRARHHFKVKGDTLTLAVNGNTLILTVKPAYKEDVNNLRRQVKEEGLTEEQAALTGFVTAGTLSRLTGKKVKTDALYDKDCYVSSSVEDLTIGADPEFVLVNPQTKRFRYAAHIFPADGVLGSDGPLAEVRPPPSTDASKVVQNIADILREGHPEITGYDWYTGATYKSPNHPAERIVHMGGHVHIGDPKSLPAALKNGVYSQIIRVLDETIALPLVRIDCPEPHLRRNTAHNGYGRYGRWGDQRPQEGRFEWRVPSGLWLSHPTFAEAVLTTTKAVSEACYQLMVDANFDETWVLAAANRKGFLKTWGAMNAREAGKLINDSAPDAINATLINRAAKKLQEMENYPRYKAQIDEFLRLVRLSDNDRKKINLDMKSTWLNNGKLISGGKR